MVTNTYELSIKLEDDGFKVIPREKEGSKQSYQNALKGFSLTLADHIGQEGSHLWYLIGDAIAHAVNPCIMDGHLQDIVKEAISEAVTVFIGDTYCVEQFFAHECQDVPIIELTGNITGLSPLVYDLKVEVVDPSEAATWVAISEWTEEDWAKVHVEGEE